MMMIKFWGAYQSLPYSVFGFRLLQGLFFLRLIISLPVMMIGVALWPFYFFWRVWRWRRHGEPFARENERWMPWGVRGGFICNLILFLAIYIGAFWAGYYHAGHKKELFQDSGYTTISPSTANQYSVKSSVNNIEVDSSFDFTEEMKRQERKLRKEEAWEQNKPDRYNDELDDYLDDPEDEIRFPPEVFEP